ncbi:G patch domain and ankyrin repeat-containing protein 1 [Thelohanellus kitauei]|uniref:G patch domain and ankyrin repeat-containing protein 1 n=1 Tax=Thelohanellus kitauei TaxID=669202 RepID=A0A0C2IY94_THEKT|nr:G patch domain and ankyrin repeat-containing protein 1 [Thelohanellus kitauei]
MESDSEYWALKYFKKASIETPVQISPLIQDSRQSYEKIIKEHEEKPIDQHNTEKANLETPNLDLKHEINDSLIKKFFDLCEKGLSKEISEILTNTDQPIKLLNELDQYGWSPLMCACASGSTHTVETLINYGGLSTLHYQDAGGNSAFSISEKLKFYDIAYLLRRKDKFYDSCLKNDTEKQQEIAEVLETVKYYCDVCDQFYSMPESHEMSISHLFNLSNQDDVSKIIKAHPGFVINKKNIGYQMMETVGWDETHGLGVEQQGRLYPIRVKVKNDRSGLGIKKPMMFKNKETYNKKLKKRFTQEQIESFRRSFR